jgi:hypothetical protein
MGGGENPDSSASSGEIGVSGDYSRVVAIAPTRKTRCTRASGTVKSKNFLKFFKKIVTK